MGAVVLELDRDVAGHLAVALHAHVQSLGAFGRACPPELLALQAIAIRLSGQERSGADSRRDAREPVPMREWLSVEQTAEVLGVSERTVRRRIAAGDLPSRKFGRARRVHRADVLERVAA